MAEKTGSTVATGSAAAPTMASAPAGGPTLKPSAGVHASPPVPPPAVPRGGRPRQDGLTPGSPEAKEADKKRDRERKQPARQEAAKVVPPPPLPSALAGPAGPGQAPAAPGSAATPGQSAAPIPWRPETLTGLVDELIDAAEENTVADYLARCNEAGLTEKLTKEIVADARFPKLAKTLLKDAIPRLTAKWMNKTGISAEYQDEVSVLTALILIVKHRTSSDARFEELISEVKKAKLPPPAPAAAPAAPAPAGPGPMVAPLKIPTSGDTVEVKI
jgi:hypothetical protein